MAFQQQTDSGLRELALFAGCGGGILGGKILGWRTVCAVELNAYRARRLMQRQNEGYLSPFPIWDDVCTFDGRPWRGLVDVVSGGDPCQGNSNAARNGIPAKTLGDQFLRIVDETKPKAVFRENPYTVRSDAPWPAIRFRNALEDIGFEAIVVKMGACCVGGYHRKMRSWVIGISKSLRQRLEGNECKIVENANGWRQDPNLTGSNWGNPTPRICRNLDVVAHRMDRLKAIGDGQVPRVVALAWRILSGHLHHKNDPD